MPTPLTRTASRIKKTFPALKPEPWITEEQAHAIHDFVNAGKGFYPLHNSSNISVYSKTFRDVMGGAYIGHPTLRPFKVRITNHTPSHHQGY